MTEPAIAVLPYHLRLSPSVALSDMLWPLGRPAHCEEGTLGDLGPQDHVIAHIKTWMHLRALPLHANVSVLLLEPARIHRLHMLLARVSGRKFYRILASNERFLAGQSNGVFLPFGTTWIPQWRDLGNEKTKMCSLIASNKRDLPGQKLRHEMVGHVVDKQLDVDVMGRGYAPFETKADGLAPYRYSVVIENSQERNYFSEKVIDAVLCETVPIYWGCPNIADFLPTDGMILCDSAQDVRAALAHMSEADYAARLPALRAAKEKAAHWGDLYGRAARLISETL